MKWIIGLDLRPSSLGALHFAAWLRSNLSAAEGQDQFVPVHVLEEEDMRPVLAFHPLAEVTADAVAAAEATLRAEGLPEAIPDLRIVQGLQAHEVLESSRASLGGNVIVIGRQAKREGVHVTRLGRVARRTLRGARAPVVVVPPDMTADDIGSGPIVLATGLGLESREASRFAAAMARRTGRAMTVVYVDRRPTVANLPYISVRSLPQVLLASAHEAERTLAEWLGSENVHPDSTAVLAGDIVDRVVSYAEEQGSPMLVVGARHREGFDRLLAPGIGRECASIARVPVAMVPARE